ncbi:hypothetical protein F5876DRAFT_65542 [Lentinula aff. lateritia]|uniref:Uncharacterized protein n=1 Tax=Lentinula aff. lateritia TaxID=2804960 RepID=A0ACC1U1C1_9AGAR|nr:hypothetical protein F5876DRAFT_65542 [Lentinula aff. lateritia]
MTTAPTSNSRASLLSGLRTGGVRSSSASIPHTAAPGGTFNIPRIVSHASSAQFVNEEPEYLPEMTSHNIYANNHYGGNRIPLTAAVDGPNNTFSQHQRGMNPNVTPFSPSFNTNAMSQANQAQQALQMQMMQLEILKIQAAQAQQYQAEMLAQAQRQQQAQNRRSSVVFNPPATAGPLSTGFDIRTATLNAQMRRANQAEQQAQLGVGSDEHVPMTATLGGKFGSRNISLNVPNSVMARYDDCGEATLPPTPSSTTVISGGTSLGHPSSNNISSGVTQSKSDSATSWRRGGGKGNSVLANRSVTSPAVKVTPPPSEATPSPPGAAFAAAVTTSKFRPQPLRFSVVAQQPLPSVTIDTSEVNDNDDSSSTSSDKSVGSHSSPTTPHSSSSNEMSLSLREEASKKLYEGLGIGRPASAVSNKDAPSQQYAEPLSNLGSHRMVSQPLRQPRGPPSGLDELQPKNFATRIRRQAIGGLGMLMDARERRDIVEVY